jgi:cobalt-zinc-cadmium efflux system outer membrane protein
LTPGGGLYGSRLDRFRLVRNLRAGDALILRALSLAALAATTAFAQGARTELTLREALTRAEAAPDVVVARAAQAVAERGIEVVRAPGSPTLTTGTHTEVAHLTLALAVPLRWGGQRGTALDVARAERDAAAADTAAAADRARETVTAAWFRLAANEELERIASARVVRLERTAAAVKDLYEAGRVPRLDVVRTQAEAASARADVFTAAAERRAAAAALAFLVGVEPGTDLAAAGERPAPAPLPDLASLQARAANAADVRAAEARGRAAESRIEKARRGGLPALTLEGGVDVNDPTVEGTDKHVSLGLTIPVGARATIAVTSAERERAAAERSRLVRSLEAEIVAAWNRTEAARQRLEALDAATLPAAREAAELADIAYRAGRLDLLRLLESERALLDSGVAREETWVFWGTERASLERFVGGKL